VFAVYAAKKLGFTWHLESSSVTSDVLDRTPPMTDSRSSYGPAPENFIDFRFPRRDRPSPVLLVFHGGFWQGAYDLSHMNRLCAALTSEGTITCNVEYRRLGNRGGGWPGTFQDVAAASDYIFEKMSSDSRFDLDRVAALGFSAGGHLALWLSGRHRVKAGSPVSSAPTGRLMGVLSIAGVSDLRTAWERRVGGDAVVRLMGGTPVELPERYEAGSPIELLPVGVKQVLVHGTGDEVVPL
jgi:acetyl esterase/lipase